MASITIQAAGGAGSCSACVLEPKAKPAGVAVLIQEIFGVNQAMRDTTAWVADLGFIAVCPDLFWRIERGIDISDKTDAERKRAFELFQAFARVKGTHWDGRSEAIANGRSAQALAAALA